MKTRLMLALAASAGIPALLAAQPSDHAAIAKVVSSLGLRTLGPGLMSGRIADIEVHPTDRSRGTWPRDRAACGRRGTRVSPGSPCSTSSRRTRSARSHSTPPEAEHEYGVSLTAWNDLPRASAIVAAVAHTEYADLGVGKLCEKLVPNGVFTDVKSCYDPAALEPAGAKVWRL